MIQADITRLTWMPRDTIRDWVNKEKNKGTYRELLIKFLLSRPLEELEEFLKGEGVDVVEFKDGRVKDESI